MPQRNKFLFYATAILFGASVPSAIALPMVGFSVWAGILCALIATASFILGPCGSPELYIEKEN